jgi:hypothetical protein
MLQSRTRVVNKKTGKPRKVSFMDREEVVFRSLADLRFAVSPLNAWGSVAMRHAKITYPTSALQAALVDTQSERHMDWRAELAHERIRPLSA